jgi:DNA-binding GntR family transcriptional regulator
MQVIEADAAYETQRERVYEHLRQALVSGAFRAGQKITIRDVSELLGVSATPVREAFRRLAAERALVMQPNRSMTVPRLSRREFLDVREVRCLLEQHAVALAAGRITPEELAEAGRLAGELAAARIARDARAITRLHKAFRFGIYRASRIPALVEAIRSLWLQSQPTLISLVRRPEALASYPVEEQNRNDAELIDALARGDEAAARRSLEKAIRDGNALLERVMDEIGWDRQAVARAA